MKWISLLLVALVGLVACGPDSTPSPSREDSPHFLLTTSGSVQIKRANWPDYIPVAFGTTLKSDDLLQIEEEARVLCADLEVKSVSGLNSTPCPPEPGILAYRGARFVSQRVGAAQTIPYILYPRHTLVLDSRPTLRWHDTGAGSYTVAVLRGGEPLWRQTDVTGSELSYPADQPPLQPNTDYLLLVMDDDSRTASRTDPAKGIGFRLATEETLAEIEAGRDRIMALNGLSDTARDFALGVYYAGLEPSESGFSPLGEAWLIFDRLAQSQDAPAVHLWRGDVLTRLKLPGEAEAAYRTALQNAQTLGDLESQAAAQAGLWRVTGEDTYFDEALTLYERVGDDVQVQALREEKG